MDRRRAARLPQPHGAWPFAPRPPARRPVGQVPRDYWDGNRFTKPYETVVSEEHRHLNRKLDHLPADPITAAIRAVDVAELGDMLVDDDLIRNGLWSRENHGAATELSDGENWDYDAVRDARVASARRRLDSSQRTGGLLGRPPPGPVTLAAPRVRLPCAPHSSLL